MNLSNHKKARHTRSQKVNGYRSAGKDPFEYLLALHQNRKEVFQSPKKFLPWTFEENLLGYQIT